MDVFNFERDVYCAENLWLSNESHTALRYRLIRDGLPLYNADRDSTIPLRLVQFRYLKQDKVTGDRYPKTKWLSGSKMNKRFLKLQKKKMLVNWCSWSFFPLAIEHERQSTNPSDQKYVYAMKMRQFPIPDAWENSHPGTTSDSAIEYYARIETRLDGSIIRKRFYPNLPHDDPPRKFAFPKRYIAKINRCLLNNYWQNLRSGRDPDCFTWQITDDGRAWYLADRGGKIDPSYRDRLLYLLNSQSGDAAAVLLAYTCFSVLKDFFPQYHVLDKSTPYLTAKKYMPTQFALNLCSTRRDAAEYLAAFFCKPFQETAWPKTTTAGIQVQSSRNESKYTILTVREFESKVLQPASVLWINRDPTDELIRGGQIVTLQVPDSIKKNTNDPIGMDLVHDLTRAAHDMLEARLESYWIACWQASKPVILETLESITRYASNCTYPIWDVDFGWAQEYLGQIREPVMPSTVLNLVNHLERCIYEDIEDYLFGAVRETPEIDAFKAAVKSEFAACRRRVKKVLQEAETKVFSLGPDYEDTLRKMECDTNQHSHSQRCRRGHGPHPYDHPRGWKVQL